MERWDSLRKLDRNKMVYEYYKAHREQSLAQIGSAFNISAQRVFQIIQALEKRIPKEG